MSTHTAVTTKTRYYADTALAPSKREIRLIELLPGLPPAEIQCTLKKVSLEDNPSYEAMSYAWGPPGGTKTILVNETSVKIPANLENAFQYLRRADIPLTIWADSICINQEDGAEKMDQVAMMGDIYSSCTSVYIWLGIPQSELETYGGGDNPGANPVLNPFALALHFANNKHLYEMPCFELSNSTGLRSFVVSPLFEAMWSGHEDASSRAWWSRLWCVQEAILSPTAMVVFGQQRVQLATLKLAELRHKHHLLNCCSQFSSLFPVADEYVYRSDHILTSMQLSRDNVDHSPPKVFSDFDRVLRTFRYKFCQNPRDRIYSLLGLLDPSMQPHIVPDYTRRIDQVYLDAMEAVMAHSDGDLRYMTGSGFNSQLHGLPSWVRNFAASVSQEVAYEEMQRYEAYNLYKAAASTRSNARVICHSILSLTGFQVDKIIEVGPPVVKFHEKTLWKILISWSSLVKRRDLVEGTASDSIGNGKFWRVILADIMLVEKQRCRRLTAEDVPWTNITDGVNGIRDFVAGPEAPTGIKVRSIQAATNGRSMFRTEAGRLGLCLPESQVGDEIWVIHGGRVPFVLRSGDVSTAKDLPGDIMRFHNFIGEAHLHGIMDGEAMSRSNSSVEEVLLM